jgi:hypothetical protein
MNIIELAKQAGFERLGHDDDDWVCYPEEIEAFAELVAAHEREKCARVCENLDLWYYEDPGKSAAIAIRAQGQA